MLLVMGDFNARMGYGTDVWRGTIGRFGLEEKNKNRVKFLGFCCQLLRFVQIPVPNIPVVVIHCCCLGQLH